MSCVSIRHFSFTNDGSCGYGSRVPPFSFLSNHGLALLCIAEDPRSRMRDIAGSLDITERAAQRIVTDLVDAGYLDRVREGRRNAYTVKTESKIELPVQRNVDIGSLLSVLAATDAEH